MNHVQISFADGDAKAHRRIQNRKNQRTRRQRLRQTDPDYTAGSPSFRVQRLRLDEFFDGRPSGISSTTITLINHTPSQGKSGHDQISARLPRFAFPLSLDHLLHLIQYNVFRAFVTNKNTLKALLTGWTDACGPVDPTTCPVSGPYRDETSVFPLNPNIPLSLAPTLLQQSCLHSIWINFFPFPRIRDNLVRRDGTFDHWELLQDLIGELMSITPTRQGQNGVTTFTVSNIGPLRESPLAPVVGDDDVTTGRRGLIVWGEPHDMNSWEATPGFLVKWPWVVDGCQDIIKSTNRWRATRGEEPLSYCNNKFLSD